MGEYEDDSGPVVGIMEVCVAGVVNGLSMLYWLNLFAPPGMRAVMLRYVAVGATIMTNMLLNMVASLKPSGMLHTRR